MVTCAPAAASATAVFLMRASRASDARNTRQIRLPASVLDVGKSRISAPFDDKKLYYTYMG